MIVMKNIFVVRVFLIVMFLSCSVPMVGMYYGCSHPALNKMDNELTTLQVEVKHYKNGDHKLIRSQKVLVDNGFEVLQSVKGLVVDCLAQMEKKDKEIAEKDKECKATIRGINDECHQKIMAMMNAQRTTDEQYEQKIGQKIKELINEQNLHKGTADELDRVRFACACSMRGKDKIMRLWRVTAAAFLGYFFYVHFFRSS